MYHFWDVLPPVPRFLLHQTSAQLLLLWGSLCLHGVRPSCCTLSAPPLPLQFFTTFSGNLD